MNRTKPLFLFTALCCALLLSGCSTFASKSSSGVVIARRAQIRSSVAVVAAELLEVSRGDVVDILESTDVQDQTVADTKERWLRVRAHDDASTEGWIEARNILTDAMLDQSRRLYDEDKSLPAQATGQLRNTSNLRLTPDYTSNDNVLMKMENGATFEIVSWKRLPKAKTGDANETGDDPKPAPSGRQNARPVPPASQPHDDEEPAGPEETTELWYKVRLQPAVSPAPAGWIYGKQVELTVPPDIIFYRTGREFVAWQRLDGDPDAHPGSKPGDSAKEDKPGSWVILEKASSDQPHTTDEPDFDRIYVVGYEKYDQEHYTAYRSPDLNGFLPMRIQGSGEDKTFTITVQGDDGKKSEAVFRIYKDDHGHMKVAAPADLPKMTPKK